MDIWEILGIDKTRDKQAIKNAYRDKLQTVNPEDNQDGFMALRGAYEEAISYADSKEESGEAVTDNEDDTITNKIKTLYSDFERRIQTECWEELFNEDEFVSLETEEEAFDKLMVFIMDNFMLPSRVFKCIVDQFDINDRKKELKEIYSEGFINYLLSRAEQDDYINYDLFEGDLSLADEYIDKYANMCGAPTFAEARPYNEELDKLDLYHPYNDVMRIRIRLDELYKECDDDRNKLADNEEAKRLAGEAHALEAKYNSEPKISFCVGEYYYISGQYELAIDKLKKLLADLPYDYYEAKMCLGSAYCMAEKYDEAKKIYIEVLEKNNTNERAYNMLSYCNKEIIEKNKAKILAGEGDNKLKFEVAWCCYQNHMLDDAIEVLSTIEQNYEDSFQYNNALGRSYLENREFDKALECFEKWRSAIKSLPDDSECSEEELKKKKRLPFVDCLTGKCYMALNQYDAALNYIEKAIAVPHDEISEAYYSKIKLLYIIKEYSKCLTLCDEMLDNNVEDQYYVLCYKARACFALDYLQECLWSCEKAIEIFPYGDMPYIQEVKAFQEANQPEDAASVIERYKEINDNELSEGLKYYEALYSDDNDRAVEIVLEVDAAYDRGEIKVADDDYVDMLLFLADVYDEEDKNDSAIAYYNKVLKLAPNHQYIHGYIAYMYRKKGEYDKALEEYSIQNEVYPAALYYSNIGTIYLNKMDYDKSYEYFMKALEMEPDRYFCVKMLARVYHLRGEYEKALETYERALNMIGEDETGKLLEVLRWKARTLVCMHRYDEGCNLLADALAEYGDKEDGGVRYELALAYTRADKYLVAEKLLSEVIDGCGDADDYDKYWDVKLLMELAGEEGYIDTARKAYEKAMTYDVEHTNIQHQYARVLFLNGCYEEARKQYELAIKEEGDEYYSELIETIKMIEGTVGEQYSEYIDKVLKLKENIESPRECIRIARMYRSLENYGEADEYLHKALSMNLCSDCGYRGCEEAYYELGLMYEAMGELDKAKEAYDKALFAHGHCGAYKKRRDAI